MNKKKILKIIKFIFLPLALVSLIVGGVSYKILNPYKPAIYNYAAYASSENISKVKQKYSYKEYKGIQDFEFAIQNNKAIGGVGPDYSIYQLIKNDKVKKINFSVLGIDPNKNILEFYTPIVQEQIAFYNQILELDKIDNDKDGKIDRMEEYIIPYFINTKVFAYNSTKIKVDQEIDFTPEELESHIKILQKLSQNGASVFSWADTKIENTATGGELQNSSTFPTNITEKNYKELIDNFQTIIQEGTGKKMSNSNNNIFVEDSDELLQSVINPRHPSQVAYLYNGDALDAYYSEDNFSSVPEGTIKIIKPKNSISILDSFVISNSVDDKTSDELLINIDEYLFKGKYMSEMEIQDLLDSTIDPNDPDQLVDFDILAATANFDFVNFTPTSEGVFQYILNNYFEGPDDPAINFYHIYDKTESKPIAPVTEMVLSNLRIYFKNKLNE
ncbi:MAG: hypothetical protein ACRDA7_01710 [Metamycoplasmataceae bacterium]